MIVLNYHELAEEYRPNAWCLTHELFDSHLALYGEKLISPATFLRHCLDPMAARTDSVLLTFDDAFVSDYTHVYSGYVESGRIPGFISFIPVDFVGSPGRLNWDMIRALDRGGVTIGSHGMTHADLTTVSDATLDRELTVSKAVLEEHLGHQMSLLAFPYGRFTRRIWEAALKAGYTHLFTIQLGYHQGFEPFLYSRLCLTNDMDAEYMRRHLLHPDGRRGLPWRISTKLGVYRQLMRWRYR